MTTRFGRKPRCYGKTAEQGARANHHGCHASCSEQHEPRQPRSWLILSVRQKKKRMKTLPLFFIGCFVNLLTTPIFAAESATIPSAAFKERGSILGVDLKAIQAALPTFEKHGMKVDGYRVIVIEEKESIVVLFEDPERPPEQMGSTKRMVSFEVRLRKTDLSIVESHFVR